MNKTINIILTVMLVLVASLGFFAYRQEQKINALQVTLWSFESKYAAPQGEAARTAEEKPIPEEVVNGMLGKIKAIENGAIILSVEFLEGKKVPGFPFVDAKIIIDANTKFREEIISREGTTEIVDRENVNISQLRRGTTIFVKATGSIIGYEVLAKEIEIMGQIKK